MNFALGFETGSTISLSDADADGLPDAWENLYGLSTSDNGSINIDNGPNGDPDHDGIANIIEWLVGLNPKLVDNSAYPKVAIAKIAGGFRLNFPTLPGRKYQLQSSATLNVWDPFGAPLVTAPTDPPGTFQIDDTTSLPKRFYRMVITAAP